MSREKNRTQGQRLRHYLSLIRFDKPVGTYLLLWPTLSALWLASHGNPRWQTVLIFTVGTFVMRSAGCIINDIADRHIDPFVERTQSRPLADGSITLLEALLLLFVLLSIALGLAWQLPLLALKLAVVGLSFAVAYPFMKRVFQAPQCVLGLAFAWGIPMAFAAVQQQVPLLAWELFAATFCWIVAYDTQYAISDRRDDLKIGVYSTAILFGRADKMMVTILQIIMLSLLGFVGVQYHFSMAYYAGLVMAALLFVYQQRLIKHRDPKQCFNAFLNNQWVGLVIFLGILF